MNVIDPQAVGNVSRNITLKTGAGVNRESRDLPFENRSHSRNLLKDAFCRLGGRGIEPQLPGRRGGFGDDEHDVSCLLIVE